MEGVRTFAHAVPEQARPVEEHLALVLARKPVVHFGPTAPEKLRHDAFHWIPQQGGVPYRHTQHRTRVSISLDPAAKWRS